MPHVTLIDPQTAGVSGDMLLSAFIDLGAELKKVEQILTLIPRNFSPCKSIRLQTKEVNRHGFRSCGIDLEISETSDEVAANELVETTQTIANSSTLSERAKSLAISSVRTLTEVEGRLHGAHNKHVHLHEAGSADTLADVLGVAAACDSLRIFDSEVYCAPVAVGSGTVTFSHGTVSVPAPAVLEIARQYSVPIVGGPVQEELATPTGLAILTNLTRKFVEGYPAIVPEKVGYGAGRKQLAGIPNVLRIIMGRTMDSGYESVEVLETNVDDVSGEVLSYTLHRVLEAGAKDAWMTSAQFKKNRPGQVLHVISAPNDVRKLADIIMIETGTLGVRHLRWNRLILDREIVTVKVPVENKTFDVRVKVARDQSGRIANMKPEFEDVELIARKVSLPVREISRLALQEANKSLK
jgi:uncharacterized protein (TIGR00299 family) protein